MPMRRRNFIAGLASTAAAWPLAALAQQPGKIPTVAYLWHAGSEKEESPYDGAVIDGFTKLGYVDGQNISLIHRFPDEKPERFKSMAAELVAMNPNVLMGGAIAAVYLRAATATIPIVFMFVPRSGGNENGRKFCSAGRQYDGTFKFRARHCG
jgi:putative ABC transport system substrate-binding protein